MFQRLLEFSRSLPPKAEWERLNEGMPANYDRGIAICFDSRGEWCGNQVRLGNADVLYRSGPSKGVDFTPCNKLAEKTPDRFIKGIRQFQAWDGIGSEKKAWLAAVIADYQIHRQEIWAAVEVEKQQAGIDKDHRGYVYLARNDLTDPVYAWPEAKAYLVAQFLVPFAKGGVRTGTCAVCGAADRTLYGNYAVIPCYNLDKRGSIAGGFSVPEAHRNLPVCGSCAPALAEAFAFAGRHFTSVMAGQTYMVLPYADSQEVQEELAYRLGKDPQRFDLGKAHDLVAQDLEIRKEFAGFGDQLAFALIFFSADQASWRVRAEVEQLLPSRLEALLRTAEEVAAAPDLQTITKDEVKGIRISASTLKTFATHGGHDSPNILRAWLVALFQNRAVDPRQFMHLLASRLVATGKSEPGKLGWMTRQAWGFYRYAVRTGLVRPSAPTIEERTMQDAIPRSPYGRYVEEHRGFFQRPELVVAFLTGCYAAQVCAAQREVRGAAPFSKKFMGRLLNEAALKSLYRDGHGKLAQYDKLGYVITGLDPDLAAAWVACGGDWRISEDEATFAFTIGYSLAYRIGQLYGREQAEETEL